MNGDLGPVARLAWLHLWQLTAVAAIVGAVVRFAWRHRPHLAYSLWVLVLVKALVPPLWSSPTGIFSWVLAEGPGPGVGHAGPTARRPDEPALPAHPPGRRAVGVSTHVARWLATDLSSSVLPAVWLMGALAGTALVVAKWNAWMRLLSRAAPTADSDVAFAVADVSRCLKVRQGVRVLVSVEFVGPLVYGFFRPTVVLPDALVTRASPEQARLILAHELVHVRRGDVFPGCLQTVAQLLWWFHPLVWWASVEASRERERCCDQEVITALGCSPAAYARTLLWVLELKSDARTRLVGPGLGHSRVTARRMEYIMRYANTRHRFAARVSQVVFVLGAVCLLPGMGLPARSGPTGESVEQATTPNQQAGPEKDAQPDAEKATITVTGRATDEKGQPIAGATIYLQSASRNSARLGTTSTDGKGRYEFRDAKLPVQAVGGGPTVGRFQVYGMAPGKGFTWHGMRTLIVGRRKDAPLPAGENSFIFTDERIQMDLTFRAPARLWGRVVDRTNGRPVAGAKFRLGGADWLDTEGKEAHHNFREFWSITSAPPTATSAETGADGRFEIQGLPSEAGFWVHINHPDYSHLNLFYATTSRPTTEFEDHPLICRSGSGSRRAS